MDLPVTDDVWITYELSCLQLLNLTECATSKHKTNSSVINTHSLTCMWQKVEWVNGSAGFLASGNWVPALAVQVVISGIPWSFSPFLIFPSNSAHDGKLSQDTIWNVLFLALCLSTSVKLTNPYLCSHNYAEQAIRKSYSIQVKNFLVYEILSCQTT
jgi:hypothetical protein